MYRLKIEKLRTANDQALLALNLETAQKKNQWFSENRPAFDFITQDLVYSAYRL